MQTERTFIQELKYQYKVGGMHIRLVFINAILFVLVGIAGMIERLSITNGGPTPVQDTLMDIFALQTDLSGLMYKPWGLFTSIFTHFSLPHCLVNMLFLYMTGRIFLQFFTGRRLLHTYIVGGIAGGLIEILAHLLFPGMEHQHGIVVGASGSIMALMTAIMVHKPSLKISFFGIIEAPFFLIPLIYIIGDLVSLGMDDGTAHFAHVGGAIIGILSASNIHSSSNIINLSETMGQRLAKFFSNLFRPKQRLRVEKGPRGMKSDEQYNVESKLRQQKIDAILDKISKSGYESLTKAEKEFLFSQSKKD